MESAAINNGITNGNNFENLYGAVIFGEMPTTSLSTFLHNWIPVNIAHNNDAMLCRWLFVGEHEYSEPFFDETIRKCLGNSKNFSGYKSVTTLSLMQEWSEHIDALMPAAFIFHVSRCGSTLVSQAIGRKQNVVSLSEVPLFDELLRLPLRGCVVTEVLADQYLAASVRFYGAKRKGTEEHLFIKLDSWHLMYYRRLRSLYPNVPFLVLYREPGAVLESNRRRRGMQGIADMVGPDVYGFPRLADNLLHPDNYMIVVLQRMFEQIIDMAKSDDRTLLMNYDEGLPTIIDKISRACGLAFSESEKEQIRKRSTFHSKYPAEKFKESNEGFAVHPRLEQLYNEAESLRAPIWSCGR